MPLSQEERLKIELQCYGCTREQHRDGINRLVDVSHPRLGGANMALGSILSDVQSMLEFAYEEAQQGSARSLDVARQHLNRVKDALFNAAPITLWVGEDAKDNLEVQNDCMNAVARAARDEGIDIWER